MVCKKENIEKVSISENMKLNGSRIFKSRGKGKKCCISIKTQNRIELFTINY